MQGHSSRRGFITTLTGIAPLATALSLRAQPSLAAAKARPVRNAVADIEAPLGGRVGVCIVDTASERTITYRANERFMMLSTFKMLAAALVLNRQESGLESLDRRIIIRERDLMEWSPITKTRLGGDGMSVAELCHASVAYSDNAAANLLLDSFGGPQALTRFMRSIGDDVTRLDRNEPTLNDPDASGLLDTTTPEAMATSMRRLLLGDALGPESRARLQRWLLATTTGDRRIRAGLPADWKTGGKTGTASRVGANDVAISWPPPAGSPPLLIAVFVDAPAARAEKRDDAIAQAAWLARTLRA